MYIERIINNKPIQFRIDVTNKILYGYENSINHDLYNAIKDYLFWSDSGMTIPFMFDNIDDELDRTSTSTTIKHSFELKKDWRYEKFKERSLVGNVEG